MRPTKQSFGFSILAIFMATSLGYATPPDTQPEKVYHPKNQSNIETIEKAKEELAVLLNKRITINYDINHSVSASGEAGRDKLIKDIFKTKDVFEVIWETQGSKWIVEKIVKDRIYVYSDRIDIPLFPLIFKNLYDFEFVVHERGSSIIIDLPNKINLEFNNDFKSDAQKIVDNLFIIQQHIDKYNEGNIEIFKKKADQYRSLKIKPPVSEQQRKFLVQANALNKHGDYAGAIELYLKAIEIDATSCPDAYLNIAFLHAQMNRFKSAIAYMKQYLLLKPEAPNARSAQDKIYEWELEIPASVTKEGLPTNVNIEPQKYQATRTYENGDKYVGEFVNREFYGKGIYTYANGDKYEGEFIDGKFTGKGTFTCSYGKQLKGNLENKVPVNFTTRCK